MRGKIYRRESKFIIRLHNSHIELMKFISGMG